MKRAAPILWACMYALLAGTGCSDGVTTDGSSDALGGGGAMGDAKGGSKAQSSTAGTTHAGGAAGARPGNAGGSTAAAAGGAGRTTGGAGGSTASSGAGGAKEPGDAAGGRTPAGGSVRDGGAGGSARDGGAAGSVRDGGAGGSVRDGGAGGSSRGAGGSVRDGGAGGLRQVTVDAQNVVGTIRPVYGAHWDPGAANGALSKNYIEMGVDMIRTHDACGINGTGCGDLDGLGKSCMFPSWTADATAAASYNFGPTDKMIQNIRAAGAEVFFRVGRSNLGGLDNNKVPADFDKYAEVVKHVVMHYNQGWANGFTYGIKYFEIWNEPDFKPFWGGTGDQYHELYGKVATAIRATEPTALIGGPANSTFNDKAGTRTSLMKYIKDNSLPFDFYSYHKYTNKSQDPYDYARMAQSFRDELDGLGFSKTEIMNTEYESSLQGDVMLGGDAGKAAFAADALIYMQDGPVDRAMSYMGISTTLTKENRAFQAVSSLSGTPARLATDGGDDKGFGVLAGLGESSKTLRVVIANYQISSTLMGPIPGGNEEVITAGAMGNLATMTYLDRRTITYSNNEGYALTVQNVPDTWGDVTVEQYRIDSSNNYKLMSSKVVKSADRPQGEIPLSGSWAHAASDPPQGVDLIVLKGAG